MSVWRIIKLSYDNAAMQMAIDEAITTAVAEGKSDNTIRFYVIKPPAITIGFNQKKIDNDLAIRRLTGGKAIFHKDELVYAIMSNTTKPIVDIYKYFNQAIVWGLNELEIAATISEKKTNAISEICYFNNNQYDVLINGKKIGGSALTRFKQVTLQQGTIMLIDNGKYWQKKGIIYPQNSLISLEEILNRKVKITEVETALSKGFEKLLKKDGKVVSFGNLSNYEKKLAKKLCDEKYIVT